MKRKRSLSHHLRGRASEVISRLRLPARKPKGDPQNVRRVAMVSAALHQWRVSKLTPRGRKRHQADCQMCRVRLRWK